MTECLNFLGYPPLGAGSSLCSERRSAMISFKASRASSKTSSSGASSNGADSASDIHAQSVSWASRSCLAFIEAKSAWIMSGSGGMGMMNVSV